MENTYFNFYSLIILIDFYAANKEFLTLQWKLGLFFVTCMYILTLSH